MESQSGGAADIIMVFANATSVPVAVGQNLSACISALADFQMSPMMETEEECDDKEPQIRETGESCNAKEAPMEETEKSDDAGELRMEEPTADAGVAVANRCK